MERPVVTVVIPVYNVEDYIEKAVNSICSQTLTDWEMFLVDDGSTDGSGILCDNLALNESRIHVIHQENQGAAAARNVGIEKAQGKYLFFMDGDDWAAQDMLFDMVCLAENYYLDAWAGTPVNNRGRNLEAIGRRFYIPSEMEADIPESQCAQMVIAGFFIETYYSDTEYYIQKQSVAPAVYGAKYEFRDVSHKLFDRNLLYTVWNKLYLTSYIKDQHILFQDVHWDDFPFNMDVIRNIERVTVTDEAYYHFIRKRQDSESERYNPALYRERETEHQKLLGLYNGWREELETSLLEEWKSHQPEITQFDEPGIQNSVLPPLPKSANAIQVEKNTDAPEQPGDEEIKAPDEQSTDAAGQEAEQSSASAAAEADVQTQDAAAQDSVEEAAAEPEQPAEHSPEEEEPAAQLPPGELTPPTPVVNIPSPQASEFISRRYLERIIGCVENLTNPSCSLSMIEKRAEIKSMINSESVRKALKEAKPKSLYLKAMLLPLRMKSSSLTLLEGKVISGVKKKNKKLFAKLKANR